MIMRGARDEKRNRKTDSNAAYRLCVQPCLLYTSIHVGLVLVLGFVLYPAFKKSSRKKMAWYDWICMLLCAAMPVYVIIRYAVFISTGFAGENIDIIMGTLLIALVMECSRSCLLYTSRCV